MPYWLNLDLLSLDVFSFVTAYYTADLVDSSIYEKK